MKNGRRGTEMSALVLFGASVFLFVCLVLSAGDFFQLESPGSNRLSFRIAFPFLHFFGLISSFLLLILLCFWSGIVFFKTEVRSLGVKITGGILAGVFLAGFLSLLVLHPEKMEKAQHWGGILGTAIGNYLAARLGTTTGSILLFLMFSVSFILGTDWFFIHAIKGVEPLQEDFDIIPLKEEETPFEESQRDSAAAQPVSGVEMDVRKEEEWEEEEERGVQVEEEWDSEEAEKERLPHEGPEQTVKAAQEEEAEPFRERAVPEETETGGEGKAHAEEGAEKEEGSAGVRRAKLDRDSGAPFPSERAASITEEIIEESKGFEKASLLKEMQSSLANLFEGEEGKRRRPSPGRREKGKAPPEDSPEGAPQLAREQPEKSLFDEAIEIVLREKRGSVSLLQRRLNINYYQASKLLEEMEKKRIVGAYKGAKAREVLISMEEWEKRMEDPSSSQRGRAIEARQE